MSKGQRLKRDYVEALPFCRTRLQRRLVYQANGLLKENAAAKKNDAISLEPMQAESDEIHRKRHRKRFEKSRWFREGRTFDWWLKRRSKMRRIDRQRQRAAAKRKGAA